MPFGDSCPEKEEYYHDLKGMGFNINGKKIINKLRELPGSEKAIIKTLDEIPFQDHDYNSHFILLGKDIVKMNIDIVTRKIIVTINILSIIDQNIYQNNTLSNTAAVVVPITFIIFFFY